MGSYADRAPSLVATLAEIARLKGADFEFKLLSQAKARLVETGYDNWNGGIDLYALILEVSVAMYAAAEDQKEKLERWILDRVNQLTRADVGESIRDVVISPILVEREHQTSNNAGDLPSAETEETPGPAPSFWAPGHFRLFVSHASEKKDSAHRLKEALATYHVAAFVAHDDIEPTREWQAEIETALRTMDGLVALVSQNFRGSQWCDQEVGTAFGRGKLVIPLRVGADPHGFMGKLQGMQTKGLDSSVVAAKVVDILIEHESSKERMTAALVERLVASNAWATSKRIATILARASRLTTAQAGRLLEAVESNPQVSDAFGVPDQIRAIVAKLAPGAP